MGKHIQTTFHHLQIIFACALLALIAQVGGQIVPLKIIDGAHEKLAVCIDGTPAGYHHDPGFGDGVNNWIVYLMGGGWCAHWTCYLRFGQFHGGTKTVGPQNFSGMLSSDQSVNPDFYNWNRVFVRYCDGASFMGDVEQDDNGRLVQLRGSRIFSAVMDELVQVKGMKIAENALLSGCSAGGLATILNCDRFKSLLPNTKTVKCVSDSGFFIRAKDFPNAEARERSFRNMIDFHNLYDILPKSCTSKMNASLCLFPEYLVGDVQTPLFLLNPIFDSYQIQYLRPNPPELEGWNTTCINDTANSTPLPNPNTCTPPQMKFIKDFGGAFLDAINGLPDNPSRGLFITSCYAHVLTASNDLWNGASCKLQDKTISQAVGGWYFDRSPIRMIDNRIDAPVKCG